MPSKADFKCHVLTGHLLNPPVLLAGSPIACVVSLRPTGGSKHENNVPCRITGMVAYVVGQYKLDQQTLAKHKLNIPTKQISAEKFISDGDPHWFDSTNLFSTAFESNTSLLYSARMTVHSNEADRLSSPVNISTILPEDVPPSVRGKLLKIAYKVLIGVQLESGDHSATSTHLLQIPFRVLPAISLYSSLCEPEHIPVSGDFHKNPPVYHPNEENPFFVPSQCNNDDGVFGIPAYDVFSTVSSEPAMTSLKVNAGDLRSALSMATNKREPHLSPSKPTRTVGDTDLESSLLESEKRMKLHRTLSCTQPTHFTVSSAKGFVGRLCLLRTLFRAEDLIRGYFNFMDAEIVCLRCTVSLQCEEWYRFNPDIMDTFAKHADINNDSAFKCLPLSEYEKLWTAESTTHCIASRTTTYSGLDLVTAGHRLSPFTLPIPPDVTPHFCVACNPVRGLAVESRWLLRMEFYLACDTHSSDFCFEAIPWKLLKTEHLACTFPILLIPSTPLQLKTSGTVVERLVS
ncbi:hypothetical protein T265_01225 [Opisthorchis viverrini]|uniref:Rgp1 n=1 Tax=Opisthorchis viverrini TaxID=6198 RepID=A0A075A079_OPIVI|nr:hypothetical protein T265_01225 [Opisthorchis viverrini]KER32736.1 hypothetical protein T265_01225 [Opisthorchis viverrini]